MNRRERMEFRVESVLLYLSSCKIVSKNMECLLNWFTVRKLFLWAMTQYKRWRQCKFVTKQSIDADLMQVPVSFASVVGVQDTKLPFCL